MSSLKVLDKKEVEAMNEVIPEFKESKIVSEVIKSKSHSLDS
jgi:CheY-like chemotaxis protein